MQITFRKCADNGKQDGQEVKCMVLNIGHIGKRLRMSNPGTHLGCEVPLER